MWQIWGGCYVLYGGDDMMTYSYIFPIIESSTGQLKAYNTGYSKETTIERNDYILNTLSTQQTQQAFTDSSRCFTICVQTRE